METISSSSSDNGSGLSADQLTLLRRQLEQIRLEAKGRLRREETAATQAEQQSEPMDAAEQTLEQDEAATAIERDRTLIWEIEHALAKMDAGTYGVSELSGDPIGFDRLEAVPWARVTTDEAEEG